MAKRNKRVSASEKEYNKLIKNVEAKIKRTQKNYGIDLTSETMRTETIKDGLTLGNIPNFSELNTKQRNEVKAKMKWFTNRSNERYQFEKNKYDVVVSKKQKKEINKIVEKAQKETINYLVEKGEIGKAELKGLSLKQQVEKFGNREYLGMRIPKLNLNAIQRQSSLADKVYALENRQMKKYYSSSEINYRQNFLDKFEQIFNSDGNGILKRLRDLPIDDFLALIYGGEISLDYLYEVEIGAVSENEALAKIENHLSDYETNILKTYQGI